MPAKSPGFGTDETSDCRRHSRFIFFSPSAHLRAARPRRASHTTRRARRLQHRAGRFKSVLADLRNRINAKQALPGLPGQPLYLARNALIGSYKDLTDANPARIGRPNKFGIPPAYFDADNEPLLDEYRKLFDVMEAPPSGAQFSNTPFKDVVDLGVVIARAKGLDAANAEAAGRIASASSMPRPMAARTSATGAPTPTRAVSRPARRRTSTAAGNGRRSSRRSLASIPSLPRATRKRKRGSAEAIIATITGPRCGTD